MSGLIYLQPRDNPEYFFRQLIHDINTNFSGLTTGGTTTGGSFVQDGLNTYTGGTDLSQTVNISALTIDNLFVSGNSYFNLISASTYSNLPKDVFLTGGTFSGGTIVLENNTGGTFSITGISGSDNFTTGATLSGRTILFNRNDLLNAYSVNLNHLFSASTFSGTTNYYSRFNSGSTIEDGIVYDNGTSVYVQAPNNNTGFNIVSPPGFYYPALGFFNVGSNYLGGISAYANSLYISGAGAPITPLLVSSVVQFPYLVATANTLTYVNSSNTLQGVKLGSGLILSTGGTLSATATGGGEVFTGGTVTGDTIFTNGVTANTISALNYLGLPIDIYVTGFTYDNANNFTIKNSTGGTLSVNINITTGLTVNGILSSSTITVDNTSNLKGTINTSFSGSSSRIVESSSAGTLSSSRELIDSFLTTGIITTLLSANSNWNNADVYIGTPIAGTYQGQQYYDSSYYYIAINDDDWIRIIRKPINNITVIGTSTNPIITVGGGKINYSITALTTSATITTTGIAQDFDMMLVRIKDSGTAQTITFDISNFEPKGQALPVTTIAGKVMTVGLIYDAVTGKFGCVSVAVEI